MAKSNSLAGKLGTDFLHDRGHTGAGLFGGIMTGVVLTDHHDGECPVPRPGDCRGRGAQDVFGAADAQIQRMAGSVLRSQVPFPCVS